MKVLGKVILAMGWSVLVTAGLLTAQSQNDDKSRVYVSDSQSWQVSGGFGLRVGARASGRPASIGRVCPDNGGIDHGIACDPSS